MKDLKAPKQSLKFGHILGSYLQSVTKVHIYLFLNYRTTLFRATSYYLAHGISVVRTIREVVLYERSYYTRGRIIS